jgi:hypothetical protein
MAMVTATRDDLISEPIREIALVRPRTADDLVTFPDDGNRYEIIGGMLFVSPAPTSRHQDVSMQLATWLNLHALQSRIGNVFAAPIDVHLIFPETKIDSTQTTKEETPPTNDE